MAGKQARVYGGELSALCESQGFVIPPFLSQLIEFIEEEGIDTHGIYRMSGNKMKNTKLRVAIEAASGGKVDLEDVSVHSAAACLKLYFRELAQPLVPFEMFQAFVQAAKSPERERVEKFACLVKELPQVNYYTLHQLVRHLKIIADNCEVNKMTFQNIGIVFGPSVVRAEVMSVQSAQLRWQSILIETMVAASEEIFPQQAPVFGCDLQELCTRYNGVPPFLTHFMNRIEKKGLKREGLYRSSAVTSKQDQFYINMLKLKVEMGDYDLSKYHWATVSIVGKCIKDFLKELPEPLIPYAAYPSFIIAAKSLHTRRADNLAILVKKLPEPNFITLLTVMRHFTNVSALSDINGLTAENVGHTFGMAVLHPEREMTLEVAMQSVKFQNRVVEVMVSSFETVFDVDPAFGVDLATKCQQDEEEVPKFLTELIEYLEREALNKAGLYKCETNPAAVNLLKQVIETGQRIVPDDLGWLDTYITADTIKQYLKELPESLIPRDLHEYFIAIAKLKSLPQKLEQYRSLVMELPDSNYQVLSYFLRHLKKIVLNKKANKSSAANMGVLFGSVLMRSPDGKINKKVIGLQNSVVEVMVRNYGSIFHRSFPVFGSNLAMLCKQERGTVPIFFTQLIEQIETNGLHAKNGIYRVSGDHSDVQSIVNQIDEGEELNLEEPALKQGKNLTAVLMHYLAELPEPLISQSTSSELIAASRCVVRDVRAEKMASILREVPECNYCTLKTLFDHLLKVVSHNSSNRMDESKLSIIFAPILMRPLFTDEPLLMMKYCNTIDVIIEWWPIISSICDKYRYAPVFGCEISTVCAREEKTVPTFFEQCIEYIEGEGLENKDIYRTLKITSAQACVTNLKKKIDQGLNLDKIEPWMTQQVVANSLKLYLKELPDPLIPYKLYDAFIAIIQNNEDHVDRVEKLAFKVKDLDFAHYHTLKLLMGHLRKITDMCEANETTPQVISTVFGQTVIRPAPSTYDDLSFKLITVENKILKAMIMEFDSVFP